MNNKDDPNLEAWLTILSLFPDFMDGWSPSTDEIGVLVRGSAPYAVKNSAHPVRIKRRGFTLH